MSPEDRVESLLARMTLDEKVGQMFQLNGWSEEHVALTRAGRLGSAMNVDGAEQFNAVQRVAVEESRLGIPLVNGRDVIHGWRTIAPIPLAQSCTWRPELSRRACEIAAVESSADGVHWTFAPMIDIARDPRWGRIAEGHGEDPRLCSRFAEAMVRGYQGETRDELVKPERIAACAKHFVAYGAAEGGRDYNTTDFSERTLEETYLPSFHAAVKAGVRTLMSAFNEISGVPASGNRHTLTEILRDRWGFDGMVISDWTSVAEMIPHGFAETPADAAHAAIDAGVDMEMVSRCYLDNVAQLIESGRLTMAQIDEAVRRVLRLKVELGLFENPYTEEGRAPSVQLTESHRADTRALAAASLVLLTNRDASLPLDADVLGSVALFGPLADDGGEQLGCWAGIGRGEDSVTVKAGLEAALPGKVRYAPGMKQALSEDPIDTGAIADVAAKADVAVVVVGEPAKLSGEAHCRTSLDLPGQQRQLVETVAAAAKKTIVVLVAGRPLTVDWMFAPDSPVDATLMAWHPGTEGGSAIAEVLLGETGPSGRLTVSWPSTVGQIPVHYNHKNTGRPAGDRPIDIEVGDPADPQGFVSTYIDASYRSRFPFGHGLTYGRIDYRDATLATPEVAPDGRIRVEVTIANTGSHAAEEVVQLYFRDLVGSTTRPVRELLDWQVVRLAPDEAKRVTFDLPVSELACLDRSLNRVVEPGGFHLFVGPNARAGEPLELRVTGDAPVAVG